MDINALKKLLSESHPGKTILVEFDAKCYKKIEFTFTEGAANITQHAEFCKVKVTVDGNVFYAPIDPHRVNIPWKDGKDFICSIDEFFISETAIKTLADHKCKIDSDNSEEKSNTSKQKQEFDFTINQFEQFTGKDRSYLLKKINDFKQEGKNENS